MKNSLDKIAAFLNVKLENLEKLPLDILLKMQDAIRQDDYFSLHHLGYSLTIK